MVFNSISNSGSVASSAPNSGKKKRGNRNAKLKQCKFDSRRQQWISQGAVNNKGCKEENSGARGLTGDGSLGMRGRGLANEGLVHHLDNNLKSVAYSPTSPFHGGVLGGNHTGLGFGWSSSCSSSGGWCSGSITEDEGDDGGLDDWEAVADALAADDNLQKEKQKQQCPSQNENTNQSGSQFRSSTVSDSAIQTAKSHLQMAVSRVPVNTRAWRLDDALRPQCLPNLSKQHSMPNLERQYARGGVTWAYDSVTSAPSSCPICYEDLDITDTKFLPCLCGFHLCLFCHKRILEEDGRCPGCRKPYNHEPVEAEASSHEGRLTFQFSRSYSMITRS